jgi:AcrR family transcriptional regulator
VEAGSHSARGERTRTRLIQAAKQVFERDGFLESRISDITAEAGLSQGSFYHYFDSKESLFRIIAEQTEVRLLSMDDIGLDPDHRSPIERIRAANHSYLKAYQQEARIMRVIEEVTRYNDDVRRVRETRGHELATRLEASIERLQSQGLVDQRIDRQYAAQALGGMVARFAEDLFFGNVKFDIAVAGEQLTLLWANALGLKDEPNPSSGSAGDGRPRSEKRPRRG